MSASSGAATTPMIPAPALACYALAAAAAVCAVLGTALTMLTSRIGPFLGVAIVGTCVTAGVILWALGRTCADVAAIRKAAEKRETAAG